MKGENSKKKFVAEIKEYVKERIRREGLESVSEILEDARERYLKGISCFVKDPQQSWKPFKGHLLEEIIMDAVLTQLNCTGLRVINGKRLDSKRLSEELSKVKRSVVVKLWQIRNASP